MPTDEGSQITPSRVSPGGCPNSGFQPVWKEARWTAGSRAGSARPVRVFVMDLDGGTGDAAADHTRPAGDCRVRSDVCRSEVAGDGQNEPGGETPRRLSHRQDRPPRDP